MSIVNIKLLHFNPLRHIPN